MAKKMEQFVSVEYAIAHIMKARNCDRQTAIRLLSESVKEGKVQTVTVNKAERQRPH